MPICCSSCEGDTKDHLRNIDLHQHTIEGKQHKYYVNGILKYQSGNLFNAMNLSKDEMSKLVVKVQAFFKMYRIRCVYSKYKYVVNNGSKNALFSEVMNMPKSRNKKVNKVLMRLGKVDFHRFTKT